MTVATAGIDSLIQDAELVLAYAARAGLLSDNRLSRAIVEARKAAQSGENADDAALATALSDAVKIISPMTLIDLQEGRSPFAASGKPATGLQFFLSIFTLALVGLIAGYMLQMQSQQDALAQIERFRDSRFLEKLSVLRRMAQHEGVLLENAETVKYDNYRQKVFELAQLQESVSGVMPVVIGAVAESNVPFSPIIELVGTLFKSKNGDKVESNVMVVQSADNQGNTSEAEQDICEQDTVKRIKPDSWLAKVTSDQLSDFCFLSRAVGSTAMYLTPLAVYVPRLKESVAVKAGWILPFLYGLLGASIYLMRSQLSTRTATITLMPALLRIALGGVAGIVIGWFGVTANSPSSVVAPSSLPFALAFMAGFSIDVLFSLLDRFNRAITVQGKP